MHITCQLSRNTIDLTAVKPPRFTLPFRFGRGHRFGKYPEIDIADDSINAFDVTDHIVVENTDNFPIVFLSVGGQSFAAVKALFFT